MELARGRSSAPPRLRVRRRTRRCPILRASPCAGARARASRRLHTRAKRRQTPTCSVSARKLVSRRRRSSLTLRRLCGVARSLLAIPMCGASVGSRARTVRAVALLQRNWPCVAGHRIGAAAWQRGPLLSHVCARAALSSLRSMSSARIACAVRTMLGSHVRLISHGNRCAARRACASQPSGRKFDPHWPPCSVRSCYNCTSCEPRCHVGVVLLAA